MPLPLQQLEAHLTRKVTDAGAYPPAGDRASAFTVSSACQMGIGIRLFTPEYKGRNWSRRASRYGRDAASIPSSSSSEPGEALANFREWLEGAMRKPARLSTN